MMFVNQIAEITHSMVDKYGGSANKNIGDAFLLVWKFKHEEEFFQDPQRIGKHNQFCADLALFSFLKIIAKINKYQHILDYRNDPALNERMPGYEVKMGFGLHQGWAIEGAIGSMFKIDASYLSPNVNMASRLEAATK
jgi:class 3 adenylate cyclase